MSKYKCIECGYIYDSEKGELNDESFAFPGTDFKYLYKNWCCPECGAGKDNFEEVEE